jgi:hypothetical protein
LTSFQVVTGLLTPSLGSQLTQCWIITTEFPSWLIVVHSLGFSNIEVYSAKHPPPGKALFSDNAFGPVVWRNLSELPSATPPDTFIFAQGEWPTFLHANPSQLGEQPWIFVGPLLQPPIIQGHHFFVTHIECGGVTDSVWSVVTNIASSWTPPPGVLRTLRSVIDQATTANGRACAPPSDDSLAHTKAWAIPHTSPPVFDWNGLLPSASPLRRVRVPTVYSKSHWVARGLSPRELARAFDLPNTISQHLAATFSAHRKALPFLLAPPAKVLHAVGSYLLAKSGGG